MTKSIRIVIIAHLIPIISLAQQEFIYSKDGFPMLNRRSMITNCLKSLHKDRSDATALGICECQINNLDRKFSKKVYKQHTKDYTVDITAMLKTDSSVEASMQACFENSGKTMLLQAEGFEAKYIENCMLVLRKTSEKQLDNNRLANFCNCQLNLVKSKKLTDAELQTLSNPNSLLFYEMLYKCGSPFSTKTDGNNSWSEGLATDINGPSSDTLPILNFNGMTYVKLKTGNSVFFWLFDTGASDMLISKETEAIFIEEKLLGNDNYLGIGEYELANGQIDTCRRYVMNNLRIGAFTVNNVSVAVSEKAKKIILGRTLLNKFSNWILDNKGNILILNK